MRSLPVWPILLESLLPRGCRGRISRYGVLPSYFWKQLPWLMLYLESRSAQESTADWVGVLSGGKYSLGNILAKSSLSDWF